MTFLHLPLSSTGRLYEDLRKYSLLTIGAESMKREKAPLSAEKPPGALDDHPLYRNGSPVAQPSDL